MQINVATVALAMVGQEAGLIAVDANGCVCVVQAAQTAIHDRAPS
jgi:hypothetical protein